MLIIPHTVANRQAYFEKKFTVSFIKIAPARKRGQKNLIPAQLAAGSACRRRPSSPHRAGCSQPLRRRAIPARGSLPDAGTDKHVVAGRKAEHEKFAGAQDTYTVEALMHDGKALQSATSHFFGSGFPEAFGIQYIDKDNQLKNVYETSWGLSTRSIGALIMVHGDDDGLVIPPHLAPVECRVIPIAQHKEGVLEKANELLDELKKAGYRVKIDDSEKSPGWKFSEQEILGIPTRIEIGPKDIENNQVVVVRRDTREKIVVSLDEITTKLREILETIQQDMYNKAEEFLKAHIDTAVTMDEMKEKFAANRGFVKACWCGDPVCEGEVKYETGGAATRCLIEDEPMISDKCIYCGKPAKHMAYWGKSY